MDLTIITNFSLSPESLKALRPQVAQTDDPAWLLWISPEFIGILTVNQDGILRGHDGKITLDATLLEDCRLVGASGEWHFWRTDDDSLAGRFRAKPAKGQDCVIEEQFLWGTDVCKNIAAWTCLTEDRGMQIWLPWTVSKPPATLRLTHFVDYDPVSGLAGIVDSMLLMPKEIKLEMGPHD